MLFLLYRQEVTFSIIWSTLLVKLCPALRVRPDSAPFYPVEQAAPRGHAAKLPARRVICLQKQPASFRQKTCGIKCHGGHFIPLSRVPPFGSIASATRLRRALPIGARLVGKKANQHRVEQKPSFL